MTREEQKQLLHAVRASLRSALEAETLVDAVRQGGYAEDLLWPLQKPHREVWEQAPVPAGSSTMADAAQQLLVAHQAALRHRAAREARPTDGRPRVLVVSGRTPDRPGTDDPRFPVQNVDAVAAQLRSTLQLIGPDLVVAGGAAGADLLAAQTAHGLGIEAHLLLEAPTERFIRESVTCAPPAERWRDIFGGLVRALRGHPEHGGIITLDVPQGGYLEATQQRLEYALEQARHRYPDEPPEQTVHVLVVTDGRDHGKSDCTAALVREATARGLVVHALDCLCPPP